MNGNETSNNFTDQNKKVDVSIKSRIVPFILVIVAALVFATGWAFGSGKVDLSFGNNSIIPSVTKASGNAPVNGLDELYQKLEANFDGDLDEQKLLDGIKSGLVKASGDQFSEYLSAEATKDFNDSLNGTFEGIGAELGKEGNYVVVVAPIKGAPAEAAGLRSKDIITKINDEDATDITLSEAVNKIRGPKGETVTLTVVRDGEELKIPIVRDAIVIDSVESRVEGTTGVITISRFGDDTVGLSRKAAQDLRAKGVKSIVLDLRGNPGGLLDAAVDVSSIWLKQESTVLLEKQDGEVVKTYKTNDDPILLDFPTVVLINEGSASASEIVAGALRDNKVATLMGTKSYGKGSVQRLIPLDNGGSLKVTIAHWFTPNGETIDKTGIEPDKKVEISKEDVQAKRDPQLDAAISSLK